MNRDFEVHMTTGKILKMFSAILMGMFSGNYSFPSFKTLLKSVLASDKIRAHYESYPEDPGALRSRERIRSLRVFPALPGFFPA